MVPDMTVATFSLRELVDALSAPSGSSVLAAFDDALADPGAFRLTDLPVPEDLISTMHQATSRFFELPFEVKAGYRYVEDQYVGWCGGEFLGQYGSADHKEMYHIGPRVAPTLRAHGVDGVLAPPANEERSAALAGCRLWPEEPVEFITTWHHYYRVMQETSVLLGRALARLLGTSEKEWFAVLGENWADLAANYYPPVTGADGVAPIYNAPHRDLTIFTILHQDQSRTGELSVQSADGNWHAVTPSPGTYVVNVGELLTYLSGGRWRAAPHQVVVAREATPATTARISVPFFYRPSDERVVTSFVDLDAAPIAVGDWVLAKKRRVATST
jgi:isopenicillin N synthase-like dioxygenase